MATKKSKKLALTEVSDFNGTPVHVGDKVVYITRTYSSATMAIGVVSGISKVFGQECIVIDKYGLKEKPTSRSFYKVCDGVGKESPIVTKAICEATCG